MKKLHTLPLLFILLIAGSCQEDQDTLPASVLGTWEMVEYNDYIQLDDVATYDFKADGTYSYSTSLRESDNDLDLGYNFLQTGTFRSEDNVLQLTIDELFYEPHRGQKLYYTREELVSGQVEPNDGYTLNYEIRDNGNTLFLPGRIEGGDVIVPDMSFEKKD